MVNNVSFGKWVNIPIKSLNSVGVVDSTYPEKSITINTDKISLSELSYSGISVKTFGFKNGVAINNLNDDKTLATIPDKSLEEVQTALGINVEKVNLNAIV